MGNSYFHYFSISLSNLCCVSLFDIHLGILLLIPINSNVIESMNVYSLTTVEVSFSSNIHQDVALPWNAKSKLKLKLFHNCYICSLAYYFDCEQYALQSIHTSLSFPPLV